MLQSIQALIITLTFTAFTFADVFMTELTDPQNSSDAGRYVELYNNGDSAVDLAAEGYHVWRWTNGNADPTSSSFKALTGTIPAGGFYIVCNDAGKFEATYGSTCDQDIGTGGAADSNGDDNIALGLYDGTDSTVLDMFGVAGEDGSGTGHEFEDGRAERASGVSASNPTWNEAGPLKCFHRISNAVGSPLSAHPNGMDFEYGNSLDNFESVFSISPTDAVLVAIFSYYD